MENGSTIYKPQFHKAVEFATHVHAGKTRKGKEMPYIVHPLSVAFIISRISDDENLHSAAILHDTIEDADPYGSVTCEDIEKAFGKDVAEIVNDVTEQDKSLSWKERKQKELEHVPYMRIESVYLKSADVLHNLYDTVAEYEQNGEETFTRFHASKEDIIKRYHNLLTALEQRDPKNPLLPEIKELLQKIQKG